MLKQMTSSRIREIVDKHSLNAALAKKAKQDLKEAARLRKSLEHQQKSFKQMREITNAIIESRKSDKINSLSSLVEKALQFFRTDGEDLHFELVPGTSYGKPNLATVLQVNNESFSLTDDTGDGFLEAIGFAFRISFWLIQHEPTDALIVLDEPFSGVHGKRIPQMMEFLKYLSETFHVQFWINTHNVLIAREADVLVKL